jgi:DNA segregation ATPase FtsK/SpoIIIE, S-DNA-T family
VARNREAIVVPEAGHSVPSEGRLLDEVVAVMSLAAAVFTLLSFASFQLGGASDHFAGRVGYELAETVVQAFGSAAYLFPLYLALVSILTFCRATAYLTMARAAGALIMTAATAVLLGLVFADRPVGFAGGWVGGFLAFGMGQAFGRQGSSLIAGTTCALSFMFVTRLTLHGAAALARRTVRQALSGARGLVRRPPMRAIGSALSRTQATAPRKRTPDASPTSGPVIVLADAVEREEKGAERQRRRRPVQGEFDFGEGDRYQIPSLSLLDSPSPLSLRVDEQVLRKSSQILEGKLADFGIQGKVVEVRPGPVITTYDIEPAPGVKVNRIVSLGDDLAMALRVPGVRILAPVPGKAVVGIEVANPRREEVRLCELLESEAFSSSPSSLTLALGKDTAGHPVTADLGRMPHLLIAGATGSGKSVALNAMIMSILYKASPRDVRFLMIDMKMLELSAYESIPHLLVPVVTDPKKAVVVLKNLVDQMEERYRIMKQRAVRSIDGYNRVIEREVGSRDTGIIELNILADEESEQEESDEPPTPERLPNIVVIVDELADLMMTMGRHVEEPITRLAQKARAAGIHLILATQRPSVDVITGLIKANFPARISFQTTSRVDSRTILDQIGAERLLGGGDMLYMPAGTARVQRLHGPLVTETEILRVANFIKNQGAPQYVLGLLEGPDDEENSGEGEDDLSDELYDQAVRLVAESRQASISWVQRRLRVGYNRAARMVERMEREGVVSPSEGGRPREVLVRKPDEE